MTKYATKDYAFGWALLSFILAGCLALSIAWGTSETYKPLKELTSFSNATCVEWQHVACTYPEQQVTVVNPEPGVESTVFKDCAAFNEWLATKRCTLYRNPAGLTASPELAKRLGLQEGSG